MRFTDAPRCCFSHSRKSPTPSDSVQRPALARDADLFWRRKAMSIERLRVLRDEPGDLEVAARGALLQAFHDPFAVLRLAVQAHLPLALEPRDGETKSDDAAQHGFDVALRRVRQRPGQGFAPLLLRGELADMAAK